MKFGRNLPRNQVPEWSAFYIDYKDLKKLIKTVQKASKGGETADLAEFFYALDRNLEDVDTFYNKKLAEYARRMSLLQERYGRAYDDTSSLDDDEAEELMGALLDLRSHLRKLQWFGEINRRGFVKITKKLDKNIPSVATQHRYIATKVDPKRFANDATATSTLATINKWLSALTETRKPNEARPPASSRVAVKGSLVLLPQSILDELDQAVKTNDIAGIESKLKEGNILANASSQPLVLNLLQRAISARAFKSVDYLLDHVKSLDEPDDINGRNCLHRLVIHIGRTKSTSRTDIVAGSQFSEQYMRPPVSLSELTLNDKEPQLLGENDEAVKMLSYLLGRLSPTQQSAINSKDSIGRIPLHYAAQFGFVNVCKIIMEKMQQWGFFQAEHSLDDPQWQDKDGYAPLHLSVIGGHPLTTQALINGQDWKQIGEIDGEPRKSMSQSGSVLAIAVKANFSIIVEMLVKAGVDLNWRDKSGETSLHLAARYDHVDCARILLDGGAEIEATESIYAWTPLHVAAVDGKMASVELLVKHGAIIEKPDSSGWTAKEHAAFRGNMAVANFLQEKILPQNPKDRPSLPSSSPPDRSDAPSGSSIENRRSNGKAPEPVKSFGHKYLKDESLVLVSLGSMDMRKIVEAVQLDHVPLASAHTTELDTALSIVISASGAQGEPTIINLPTQENVMTDPIVFTTKDASGVKLLFDLVPTYSTGQRKIGRAVALLSSVRPSIGAKRMNLQGDVCVPIVDSNLDVIGAVNFNFLVITPFTHPNIEITSDKTYWKEMSSTMVIGHRGLGKNAMSTKSLQLGENTVPSFIAAANLGAQYVEFDVQLTKDHVPVIYHDFLVSETGIDAPVHTLTLEQFLHINPDSSRAPSPGSSGGLSRSTSVGPPRRSRTLGFAGDGHKEMEERMKHTRDFKSKGYKGNSRGNFIQAPFATLQDLFQQLPESVGFNIEMKYPMLHESEEQEMDAYAVELNSFCDTVLAKVYDLMGARHIIFSSFNPDICLCLSFKQPSIPIMFLTDAGICPVGDIRASSLQEAVRFASRWNLLGVVSAVEPLINSPRLVKVVKESGLVCVSYGTLNNDTKMVQKQVQEGIDAVIVDNVLAIRQGLTAHEKAQAEENATSILLDATEDVARVQAT
ncbi:Glycerophosphodiester phosphodiesterase gde1 [Ceratocystis fimbriata CBS 114723]|uniref:Glycerophosphodiester phosphodiesterase gde1 n=1 Tax=Ceratocystis fimbriata CBS 114723 TaxID=1035309 RepID=A0A2C5X940_9PEZI|nr:Glycerophosphodiester phosphodiesterase gde1 [Ceratocystis fimbriata CBS 114723]